MRPLLLAGAAALTLAVASPAQAGGWKPLVGPHHHGHAGWAKGAAIGVIGCAAGVVFAAMAVNATQNRPLTAAEAWTCGLGALLAPPVVAASAPGEPVVARY